MPLLCLSARVLFRLQPCECGAVAIRICLHTVDRTRGVIASGPQAPPRPCMSLTSRSGIAVQRETRRPAARLFRSPILRHPDGAHRDRGTFAWRNARLKRTRRHLPPDLPCIPSFSNPVTFVVGKIGVRDAAHRHTSHCTRVPATSATVVCAYCVSVKRKAQSHIRAAE